MNKGVALFFIDLVLVRIGLQQKPCNLQLSFTSCDEERGGAIFQGLVLVCICLQQKPYNLQLSFISCVEQRGEAILIALVLVRLGLQQKASPQAGHGRLPTSAGEFDDDHVLILNLGLAAFVE